MGIRHLVAGLILTMAAVPRAEAQNDRYGIHTYYLSSYLGEKSRELGAGFVRIQLDWDTLQPTGPDDWNDESFLNWMGQARKNRLKLFATLANTPAWAGPCQHCMPDSGGSWENFVYRVMAEARLRYPDVEIVYGIWNEPNLTGPRGFFMGTSSDYATLFALADAARRVANPAARLGGPELADGGPDPYGYLDGVMMKLQPYLRPSDVITVHWYPGQGSLPEWIAAAAARSHGQEVWLTETGANTCSDTDQRRWMDFIVNTFDFGSPSRQWTKMFWYYLWDASTDCAANIVRMDGSNRPAFSDYRNRATGRFSPVSGVALRTVSGRYLFDLEMFDLVDLNGGPLRDGDAIALQTPRGLYLQADHGGGGPVLRTGFAPSAWETFTLIDRDRPDDIVTNGDHIALLSSSHLYVSVEPGRAGAVNANSESIGAWETFQLVLR